MTVYAGFARFFDIVNGFLIDAVAHCVCGDEPHVSTKRSLTDVKFISIWFDQRLMGINLAEIIVRTDHDWLVAWAVWDTGYASRCFGLFQACR